MVDVRVPLRWVKQRVWSQGAEPNRGLGMLSCSTLVLDASKTTTQHQPIVTSFDLKHNPDILTVMIQLPLIPRLNNCHSFQD